MRRGPGQANYAQVLARAIMLNAGRIPQTGAQLLEISSLAVSSRTRRAGAAGRGASAWSYRWRCTPGA